MKNTKHYDDRFDRGEDFTPVTDFPDEASSFRERK